MAISKRGSCSVARLKKNKAKFGHKQFQKGQILKNVKAQEKAKFSSKNCLKKQNLSKNFMIVFSSRNLSIKVLKICHVTVFCQILIAHHRCTAQLAQKNQKWTYTPNKEMFGVKVQKSRYTLDMPLFSHKPLTLCLISALFI